VNGKSGHRRIRKSVLTLSCAGQAFSGYLQVAIYKTLDVKAGLPGWRWLYIICGLMTLPCGIACLCFLPDFSANTKGQRFR
jgi:MFS family permease